MLKLIQFGVNNSVYIFELNTLLIISKKHQKNIRRKDKPSMKIEKIKCIYVFLFTFHFIFFGCSKEMKQTSPKKQSEEVSEILNSLKQQEKMLVRLQSLTADQILRNSELEQSIPPRDLLESLQNGLVDLRAKTIILEKQVSELQKGLEKNLKVSEDSKTFETRLPADQKQILLGLISIQAGNPNQAKEYLQEVLKNEKSTKLKGEILMAIGHSFLSQGYAKQAASHYGIFLRDYPKNFHVPQALYYLGEAMQDLGEKRKKKVLWRDLIEKYPKSFFAKRASKNLTRSIESKKSNKK